MYVETVQTFTHAWSKGDSLLPGGVWHAHGNQSKQRGTAQHCTQLYSAKEFAEAGQRRSRAGQERTGQKQGRAEAGQTCSVRRVLRACRVPALSALCCWLCWLLNWLVRIPDSSPSSSTTWLASRASLCCRPCCKHSFQSFGVQLRQELDTMWLLCDSSQTIVQWSMHVHDSGDFSSCDIWLASHSPPPPGQLIRKS